MVSGVVVLLEGAWSPSTNISEADGKALHSSYSSLITKPASSTSDSCEETGFDLDLNKKVKTNQLAVLCWQSKTRLNKGKEAAQWF